MKHIPHWRFGIEAFFIKPYTVCRDTKVPVAAAISEPNRQAVVLLWQAVIARYQPREAIVIR